MTFDEMLAKVLEIFPDAVAGEQGEEIVISTGMRLLADNTVTPIEY